MVDTSLFVLKLYGETYQALEHLYMQERKIYHHS